MTHQRTFFLVKPDGMQIPEVFATLTNCGLVLDQIKPVVATPEQLAEHYAHVADKPFFPAIVDYMTQSPVLVGTLSGPNAVQVWRDILGATNPEQAAPDTLRGRFGRVVPDNIYNVAHGSDSVESAEREAGIWL